MIEQKRRKILTAVAGISFIQGLQYCVAPVLEQIRQHFPDTAVSLVQMLITAPALLAMAVAVISGWLVVKVSKKKMLVVAGFLAGVLGFVPLLADDFRLLLLSRTLYGIPLGLATALNTAVVADFFEGDERVSAMGFQAASVGAGMVVVTTVGGMLGAGDFTHAYFINVIGFISMILIAVCLPDTGSVQAGGTEKITLNKKVFQVSAFGFLEFFFLITFTTNIAMHISGGLAGNSQVSGILTGIFSGAQILIGLVLVYLTKKTGKYTLPTAMLSFCAGGILMILFPENLAMLIAGAVFCGFSQGVFIPTAMVEVADSVRPAAAAMGSACFTCAMCMGQLASPVILNKAAELLLHEVNTKNVYIIATAGMAAAAAGAVLWKRENKDKKSMNK